MTLLPRCLLAIALVAFTARLGHALTEQEEMVQKADITVQKILQGIQLKNCYRKQRAC